MTKRNDPDPDPEIEQWPRLTRFYGIPPRELARTPRWLIMLYLEAIPSLTAEEQLVAFQVSDFPHMEERDRKQVHRQVQRIASGKGEPPAPQQRGVDPSKDGGMLAATGIALKIEPPTPKDASA